MGEFTITPNDLGGFAYSKTEWFVLGPQRTIDRSGRPGKFKPEVVSGVLNISIFKIQEGMNESPTKTNNNTNESLRKSMKETPTPKNNNTNESLRKSDAPRNDNH